MTRIGTGSQRVPCLFVLGTAFVGFRVSTDTDLTTAADTHCNSGTGVNEFACPMKSMSRRTFVATIALVGLGLSSAVCAQGTAPAEQIGTLFQNVRLFDGKSATLSASMNVLVRGNTIEKISEDPIPTERLANTNVIAGGGRTLMPGLIDMHWHTMLVRPTPAAGATISCR